MKNNLKFTNMFLLLLGGFSSIAFAATGSITIDDGGNTGQISIEGSVLDADSLTFVAAGSVNAAGANVLTLQSGATGSTTRHGLKPR